jgi:O-antigen/teichoic acid export membrane protein
MWTTTGLVVSSACAAAVVFIVARRLGTAQAGVFWGIGAFVNLAALFGALGARETVVQRGSRDATQLPSAWGVLLGANVVVGVPLLAFTIGAAALLLRDDLAAIAVIAVAEFVSNGLVKAPGNVWVALDRFRSVAAVAIFDSALRVLAAASLLLGEPSVLRLAIALLVVMVVGAVVVNVAVLRAVGRPSCDRATMVSTFRTGAAFSVGAVSGAVQTNIDQFMLLRAGLLVDTGLYAAGVRILQYSMLPLHALIGASQGEFFRRGGAGVGEATRYARRLAGPMVVIATAGALVTLAVSPFLGRILGDEFDRITPVVAALIGFPALRALQSTSTAALASSGHQGFTARAQIATAALNVALNLPLIAWLGWQGAVISTYVCEVLFLVVIRRGAQRRLAAAASSDAG